MALGAIERSKRLRKHDLDFFNASLVIVALILLAYFVLLIAVGVRR
jgi:hypothetical protein